jgi:hypothetical protein
VGRLLDMSAVALQLEEEASPQAHKLLGEARANPGHDTLAAARDAQQAVVTGLDALLQRMDEWEDYQEVLLLVKTLTTTSKDCAPHAGSALRGRPELMRRLSLPLCALLLLPRAVAQDEAGESAQARLLRDQARVGQRLTSLREKLERLAQRYTDEGRDRNASLLRDALTRFDEQKLLDVQRDVQRGLEQGSLSTVERQDALAAGLEAVYAILRDRRDVEELSRQTDLAREGLAQLSVLAENQRRLLAATRATTDSPSDLLQQALQRALDLANALSRAQQAAQLGADADRQMGESSLAAELAARQRELAAEAQPTSDTQSLLEQALALLREKLAQPSQASRAGCRPSCWRQRSRRQPGRESAADAAAAMPRARGASRGRRGEAAARRAAPARAMVVSRQARRRQVAGRDAAGQPEREPPPARAALREPADGAAGRAGRSAGESPPRESRSRPLRRGRRAASRRPAGR